MSRGVMTGYYTENLSAERLRQVYAIAPPRIRQYLEAEARYVLDRMGPGDNILELGCGYGRILPELSGKAASIVGIDTSLASLLLGRRMLSGCSNCRLVCMDATRLAFADQVFDLVVCVQNGISVFHADKRALLDESIRVTRSGGSVLFSTYADSIWSARLNWFELQAQAGLLGKIDYMRTGNGVIVCEDGFTATTIRPQQFLALAKDFDVGVRIVEVNGSSVFYELVPK
jgi:SAM-dependent methyltransferase